MKEKIKLLLMVVLIIIIDQILKLNIVKMEPNIFYKCFILTIANYSNTQQAYSLGADSIILLLAINVLIICLLVKLLTKNYNNMNKAVKIGICMILAGETSNFYDRIIRGYITRGVCLFKDIIFNIADISIAIGIAISIFTFLLLMVKNQEDS